MNNGDVTVLPFGDPISPRPLSLRLWRASSVFRVPVEIFSSPLPSCWRHGGGAVRWRFPCPLRVGLLHLFFFLAVLLGLDASLFRGMGMGLSSRIFDTCCNSWDRISTTFSYFCMYRSSGWASVMVLPGNTWKGQSLLKYRFRQRIIITWEAYLRWEYGDGWDEIAWHIILGRVLK